MYNFILEVYLLIAIVFWVVHSLWGAFVIPSDEKTNRRVSFFTVVSTLTTVFFASLIFFYDAGHDLKTVRSAFLFVYFVISVLMLFVGGLVFLSVIHHGRTGDISRLERLQIKAYMILLLFPLLVWIVSNGYYKPLPEDVLTLLRNTY